MSLIVSDVERSVALYQRLFDLPVVSRQGTGVNLGAGSDAFIGFYQAPPNGAPHYNHLCLGLERFDAEETMRALAAHGVEGESRVRDGVPQVYFADPDNLRVQLQDVSFCGGLGLLGNECS